MNVFGRCVKELFFKKTYKTNFIQNNNKKKKIKTQLMHMEPKLQLSLYKRISYTCFFNIKAIHFLIHIIISEKTIKNVFGLRKSIKKKFSLFASFGCF